MGTKEPLARLSSAVNTMSRRPVCMPPVGGGAPYFCAAEPARAERWRQTRLRRQQSFPLPEGLPAEEMGSAAAGGTGTAVLAESAGASRAGGGGAALARCVGWAAGVGGGAGRRSSRRREQAQASQRFAGPAHVPAVMRAGVEGAEAGDGLGALPRPAHVGAFVALADQYLAGTLHGPRAEREGTRDEGGVRHARHVVALCDRRSAITRLPV